MLKRLFKLLMVIVVIAGALTFYSFKIEPYRLKVNEYTLNKEVESDRQFVLVQISDLHIKGDYTYENLVRVVDEVNKIEADLVVFTGDLYDNYSRYSDDVNIVSELNRIEAKIAKLAVWGNRDYGGGAAQHYPSLIHAGGFDLIRNESRIYNISGLNILVTGLDDKLLGSPIMPYVEDESNYDYKILLSHEPDIVDHYLDYGFELSLSGHSHGGQINIPFLPFINKWAVSNTEFATKYIAGFYDLVEDGSQIIYVNTGLGTTHISARLGVVPEITVFKIKVDD